MPYCPACGVRVDAADTYCYDCGAALQGRPGDTQAGGTDQTAGGGSRGENGSSETPRASSRPYDERGEDAAKPQEGRPPRQAEDGAKNPPTSGSPSAGGRQRRNDSRRRPNRTRPGSNRRRTRSRPEPRQGGHRPTPEGRREVAADRTQPTPGPGSRPQYGGAQQRRRGSYRRYDNTGTQIGDGRVQYAFSLPKSRGWEPLVFGSLCNVTSFLLVPIFTLNGYVFRLTEAAADGRSFQPAFDDPVDLTIRGLLYTLLFALLVTVGLTLMAVAGPGLAALTTDAIGGTAALLVGLAVSYVSPAILTLYPATGSLRVALSPRRIADFAATGKYFVSFLGFVLLMFGVAIASILLFIFVIILIFTIIGILVALPLIYALPVYVHYIVGSYWGATFHEAVQEGLVEPPAGADTDQRSSNDPITGHGHQDSHTTSYR